MKRTADISNLECIADRRETVFLLEEDLGELSELAASAGLEVRGIALQGAEEPLEVVWVDDVTWEVAVPLQVGPNELTLLATDLRGDVVGSDAVVVTLEPGR